MNDARLADRERLRQSAVGMLRQREHVVRAVPLDVRDPRRSLNIDGQRGKVRLETFAAERSRARREIAGLSDQRANQRERERIEHGILRERERRRGVNLNARTGERVRHLPKAREQGQIRERRMAQGLYMATRTRTYFAVAAQRTAVWM